ncbi:hypothetical protein [Larsenimonas salina]|uniref:hypothetical protein n=1 Tax=Larsenimonas salina TaxID=1295565 RepID=UPI002073BB9D|nr:hypothetical protein [Larsenimonas salina]MCM5704289.1 hypothetical protein [Larsenimonas salina]
MNGRIRGMIAGVGAALLSGCALQGTDPLASGPAPEPQTGCRLALERPATNVDWMRAASEALKAQHYHVSDSDAELGVLNARRVRSLPGLGATELVSGVDGFPGMYHAEGRINDPWQVFRGDPRRIDRVTLFNDGGELRLTRGTTVLSDRNFPIDARPTAQTGFCVGLLDAVADRLDLKEGAQ